MSESIRNIFNGLDSITYNHSIRVMSLASDYTKYANLDTNILTEAALVHDIGKALISMRVLDKVESLSPVEREIISVHAYMGYRILNYHNVDESICRIVLYHHGEDPVTLSHIEEYNDANILQYAKVLRTLDMFEAITADRPYHNAIPIREAISQLSENKLCDLGTIEFLKNQAKLAKMAKENNGSVRCAIDKRYYLRDMSLVDSVLSQWDRMRIIS